MTKYLGIDWGLTHIGLATSESMLGTPLVSLRNDENLLTKLSQILKTQEVDTIVCGIPEGKLAPLIEKFARDLHNLTGLEVILHQETLSTQEALQKLNQIGASRGKKKNDHAYAACLILEDYLELNTTT